MSLAIELALAAGRALLAFVFKPSNLIIAGVMSVLVFIYGFHKGDAHRDRIWVAKVTAEKVAQEKIIKDATDQANAEVERLNTELEARNALVEQLRQQAEADPDAHRPAFNINGVRRVNRGRAPRP